MSRWAAPCKNPRRRPQPPGPRPQLGIVGPFRHICVGFVVLSGRRMDPGTKPDLDLKRARQPMRRPRRIWTEKVLTLSRGEEDDGTSTAYQGYIR